MTQHVPPGTLGLRHSAAASTPAVGRTIPAPDGLRVLAIAAVLADHGGVEGLRGGFIGVDIFFVLSGFLITSLLLAEVDRRGRIDLAGFWTRRARRLLPALVVLVVVVGSARALFPEDAVAGLRGDALAALGWVANWRFAAARTAYFAQGGTASPLQHTWSLGVEGQDYLIWPLVVVAVAAGVGLLVRRRRLAGAAAAAAMVIASVQLDPRGPLTRALAIRPMVALGRISYGVYLWHWPVFLILDGARTGLTGLPLFTVRCVATLVLAGASWVLIEQPIRRSGSLGRIRAVQPTGRKAGRQPVPEDDPVRVDRWNMLLRTAATASGVNMLDLHSKLCPDGRYSQSVGGLRVRSDGVHLTPGGVS